jgi:translation initiation factor 2 beta subunit (eIF-2beta)/eIF-5
MNPQIEQLKEDIAILQKKLNKLEDIEKRNAIPRMNLENEGKFDIVTYNNDIFYRLEYPTGILWYKRKGNMITDTTLKLITDLETHRLLEGVWYNDVEVKREKKGLQPKPQSPEEVEERLRDAMRQRRT